MSKGIARIGLLVAAVAVNVVPGAGQLISGALANVALGVGLTTVTGAFALEAAIGTAVTLASVAVGLSAAEKVLGIGPKAPALSSTMLGRLNINSNPTTDRKAVFGRTLLPADLRW